MSRVVVVGGGFGGLLVAVELKRRGVEVLVLEAGGRPGGVAATVREDGYLLEPAAGSMLLPHRAMSPILAAANVDMVRAVASKRFVYERSSLYTAGPGLVTSGLVSWPGKLRALREPWVKPTAGIDESLASFFVRRLGHETGSLASTLMAHGVFAGDPERLSARSAFPKIVALEDEAGSLVRGGMARKKSRPDNHPRSAMHVAPTGMADMASQLAAYLGSDYRPTWPVSAISRRQSGWVVEGPQEVRAEVVIVALAPSKARHLVPGPIADVLKQARAAPVAVVGLGIPDLTLPGGFGALVGPNAGLRSLGVLFESAYAPGRAPDGAALVKVIVGGAADPAVLETGDSDLVELVTGEVGQILGATVRPTWSRVIRHAGIPQYDIGHARWLRELDGSLAAYPDLYLAGWGYRGIGLTSLAEDAVWLADRMS